MSKNNLTTKKTKVSPCKGTESYYIISLIHDLEHEENNSKRVPFKTFKKSYDDTFRAWETNLDHFSNCDYELNYFLISRLNKLGYFSCINSDFEEYYSVMRIDFKYDSENFSEDDDERLIDNYNFKSTKDFKNKIEKQINKLLNLCYLGSDAYGEGNFDLAKDWFPGFTGEFEIFLIDEQTTLEKIIQEYYSDEGLLIVKDSEIE